MRYLLMALLLPITCLADETAKSFHYQYTQDVEIVLLPDQCDKQDVSSGWIAYATNGTDKANGCWRHHGETVQIWLDAGSGKFIDYEIYKSKFEARY